LDFTGSCSLRNKIDQSLQQMMERMLIAQSAMLADQGEIKSQRAVSHKAAEAIEEAHQERMLSFLK
jgi:hypothetical protein